MSVRVDKIEMCLTELIEVVGAVELQEFTSLKYPVDMGFELESVLVEGSKHRKS
jgi:hypothetical protein